MRVTNNIQMIRELFFTFPTYVIIHILQKNRMYSGDFCETNVKNVREPYKSYLCRIFCALRGNIVFLFEIHRFCRKSVLSWVPRCRIPPGVVPSFSICLRKNSQTKMLISSLSLCERSDLFSSDFSVEKECNSKVSWVYESCLFGAQTYCETEFLTFCHHQEEFTLRNY